MTELYEKICEAAREAGRIIMDAKKDKHTQEKTSRHDLVTEYDVRVQHFLQERLLTILPGAGFFGEEDGGQCRLHGEWLFIVDPIDGTSNFIWDLHRSCVSIGLERAGEIVFGVVYNPYQDELFTAVRGEGAYCNGVRIHVSGDPMEHTMAYAGMAPYNPEHMDMTFRMARKLAEACVDVRRSGSAALELCDVAMGRMGAYVECTAAPWDYAAGALIVREAGGVTGDLEGRPLQYRQKTSVAAASALCWEPLMALTESARQELAQEATGKKD